MGHSVLATAEERMSKGELDYNNIQLIIIQSHQHPCERPDRSGVGCAFD
jgi:hypothetical protein